ncbi:hypothetical protein RN001_003169 [Aquatica leii]|uniref:Uncharacterized protein n=1 Tax=Aquatica leii TaxID=1421715 RepID=A0AAN7PI73_9COLE|nr:hypothetical protein RN001_003169 [Aquatica leii]
MGKTYQNYSYCSSFILFLLLVCNCESARTHSSGRRGGHTTSRSKYTTHNSNSNYQTTQSSIGFENYQRPQNNGNIGFENVQNRAPQNNQPYYNPANNNKPSAPQLPQQSNHYTPQQSPGIGFENVHNRVPPNNPSNHPTNYNPSSPPYQNQHSPYPNYNGQPGYSNYPNTPHYNGYQPPPSYYNPHYSSPGGVPPPIYQPVQQSSGGSILGYAGTFAGGYLIGKLASGGFSSNGGDREYTVHHYHHNANEVPKHVSVTSNGLIMCSQNDTQGLCVPNTFPFCLSNGTIMCVTHSTYTTPCNTNNSMPCVVTVLPCPSNDTSCNNSTGANLTTTAVYIPCISKVTVIQQTVLNFTADNSLSNQPSSVTNVDYCITAIAEPKQLQSAVPSYFNFLMQMAAAAYNKTMNVNNNKTDTTTIASYNTQNKTEITTLLPTSNNENKTEITTLPYNVS